MLWCETPKFKSKICCSLMMAPSESPQALPPPLFFPGFKWGWCSLTGWLCNVRGWKRLEQSKCWVHAGHSHSVPALSTKQGRGLWGAVPNVQQEEALWIKTLLYQNISPSFVQHYTTEVPPYLVPSRWRSLRRQLRKGYRFVPRYLWLSSNSWLVYTHSCLLRLKLADLRNFQM